MVHGYYFAEPDLTVFVMHLLLFTTHSHWRETFLESTKLQEYTTKQFLPCVCMCGQWGWVVGGKGYF